MIRVLFFLIGLMFAVPALAQPNIVVITTDDQEYDTMSVMPKTLALLPLEFTNSFAEFTLCCPSRTAFLTGKLAHNHQIWGNNAADHGGYAQYKALWEGDDLGVWLQEAGYQTAAIGKWLNGYSDFPAHVPAGWDEWFAYNGPQGGENYDHFGGTFNHNGTTETYTTEYQTSILGDKVDAFLDGVGEQPFFLWVTPHEPHEPYEAEAQYDGTEANCQLVTTPDFNENDVSDKPKAIKNLAKLTAAQIEDKRQKRCKTLEMLKSVDDLVERIYNKLQALGKLDDTYIIFTSDNGWLWGSHRASKKMWPYERSIRVPLLMRGPGVPTGTNSDLVLNVDITATVLQIAGVSKTIDGSPLLGPTRTDMKLMGREGKSGSALWHGIRTQRWKYIEIVGGEKELYDLLNDPYELVSKHSASGLYACVRNKLAQRLATMKNCVGANCFVTLPAPEIGC